MKYNLQKLINLIYILIIILSISVIAFIIFRIQYYSITYELQLRQNYLIILYCSIITILLSLSLFFLNNKLKQISFYILTIFCIILYSVELILIITPNFRTNDRQIETGNGWIEVNTEILDPNSIVKEIQKGNFYSSTGVSIDNIFVSNNEIKIDIKNINNEEFTTQFIGTKVNFDQETIKNNNLNQSKLFSNLTYSDDIGEILYETKENPAVYKFVGNEIYVRAKIISNQGHHNQATVNDFKKAWLQPIKIFNNTQNNKKLTKNNWKKGLLHNHSMASNARGPTQFQSSNAPPEYVINLYKNKGYNFVSLSEHNIIAKNDKWVEILSSKISPGDNFNLDILNKHLEILGEDFYDIKHKNKKTFLKLKSLKNLANKFNEKEKFILITSAEVIAKKVHMVLVNHTDEILPIESDNYNRFDMFKRLTIEKNKQIKEYKKPIILIIAHPERGYLIEDLVKVDQTVYFEVKNTRHASWGCAHKSVNERLWDIALTLRFIEGKKPIYAFSTDDAHRYYIVRKDTLKRFLKLTNLRYWINFSKNPKDVCSTF